MGDGGLVSQEAGGVWAANVRNKQNVIERAHLPIFPYIIIFDLPTTLAAAILSRRKAL
jgi:hypothetical protein